MNRLAFLRSLIAAPAAVVALAMLEAKEKTGFKCVEKLVRDMRLLDEMHLHKAKEIQDHAKLIPVRRNGKPFVLKFTNP